MTAITAQIQVNTIEGLIERARFVRALAVGSTVFTLLIALLALALAAVA